MGFRDRLKSLFIIDDEPQDKKDKVEKKQQKETPAAQPSTPKKASKVATSTGAKEGKVTGKFMEILFGAMEKHNLDGFDYLEFKQSLKSLEKMPMDEQTRYQSALAMAKTMGATPKALMDAANHYLNVLQKEEKKFEQALINQRERQIGGREQQIKGLENGIRQKAEQIKRLTQEIEKDQKQLAAIKQEIAGAIKKVENTKSNFIASYNTIVAQIQGDLENMKRFLK